MNGRPALSSGLVAVLVIFGWMEDGDADFTVGIDLIVVRVSYVAGIQGKAKIWNWVPLG